MKKPSILLILLLLLSINAFSQKSKSVAYAVLKDSTLTFYYNIKKQKPAGAYDVENMVKDSYGSNCKEWYSVFNKISTVVFDNSFKEYRPKSCSRWFNGCENLTSVKGIKENLNTSEVADMSYMFGLCKNLPSLDVSGFNTETVANMKRMFWGCNNLTALNVSGFNTKNVTDMSYMFWGCKLLTTIDVSGFDTENVTDMSGMFDTCINLTTIDVSGFNTDNVSSMWYMFANCENLTAIDVSGFNTGKVTDIRGMFRNCKNLKTIYVGDGWNISNVQHSDFMFTNCPNLIGGKGTKYDEKHTNGSYAHIDGGESNPGYFTKKTK